MVQSEEALLAFSVLIDITIEYLVLFYFWFSCDSCVIVLTGSNTLTLYFLSMITSSVCFCFFPCDFFQFPFNQSCACVRAYGLPFVMWLAWCHGCRPLWWTEGKCSTLAPQISQVGLVKAGSLNSPQPVLHDSSFDCFFFSFLTHFPWACTVVLTALNIIWGEYGGWDKKIYRCPSIRENLLQKLWSWKQFPRGSGG